MKTLEWICFFICITSIFINAFLIQAGLSETKWFQMTAALLIISALILFGSFLLRKRHAK